MPKKKSTKRTIGFIGLGLMGQAFSKNLIADGHRLVGTDVLRGGNSSAWGERPWNRPETWPKPPRWCSSPFPIPRYPFRPHVGKMGIWPARPNWRQKSCSTRRRRTRRIRKNTPNCAGRKELPTWTPA
ncbi:MAG: hypothetical protein J4F48_06110 [Nitrospinae bacterium]|nr:hypothetical protein [Nitrospinota bacterium]